MEKVSVMRLVFFFYPSSIKILLQSKSTKFSLNSFKYLQIGHYARFTCARCIQQLRPHHGAMQNRKTISSRKIVLDVIVNIELTVQQNPEVPDTFGVIKNCYVIYN